MTEAASPTAPIQGFDEPRKDPLKVKTLVERIKDKLSLTDYAARFMELKPAGKGEVVGLCPMHDEKSPSFHINTEKQIYHCKGCGQSGNVIQLFAFMNGLSPMDGKVALGKELGVFNERALDSGESLLRSTARLYIDQLGRKDNALQYLKSRGLTEETIEKFGVGFCWGREVERLSPELQKIAVSAGIAREEDKKGFMAGRITFPIRDRAGRVVGFGGRLVPSDDYVAVGPKYKNSPESEYFKKSELLYGLYEAAAGISRAGFAVAVEGYMDVLGLHQAGVENSFAVMGASTSESAFKQIWQMTSHLVYCLDPDMAGQKGTFRSVMAAAPTMHDGCKITIATLPDGLDPDVYVLKYGPEAFQSLIARGVPLSTYLLQQKLHDYDLSTAEGRASLLVAVDEIAGVFPGAPHISQQIKEEARILCASALVEAALRKIQLPAELDQREVELAISMLQRLMPDVPRLQGSERIAQIRKTSMFRRAQS